MKLQKRIGNIYVLKKEQGIVDINFEGDELVYLMTLVVDPEFQRLSIGTKLINQLIQTILRTTNLVRALFLHVLVTNV